MFQSQKQVLAHFPFIHLVTAYQFVSCACFLYVFCVNLFMNVWFVQVYVAV